MAFPLLLLLTAMTSLIQVNAGVDPSLTVETQQTEANLLKSLSQMLKADQEGFRSCPPPYTHILGECFYIHMYIPLLTWKDASTFCEQAGGILAEPKYFGAIIAHIYNEGLADNIFRGIFNRLWLGGRRVGNTTTFQWSSGRPISEPVSEEDDRYFDDLGGDCIMMKMVKDTPSHLRANSCNTKTHYVCQLP